MKTFIVHTRAVLISVISIAISYIVVEVIRQSGELEWATLGWATLAAVGPTVLGYLEWLRRKYGSVTEEVTTTETTKTVVVKPPEGPVGPGALP